MSRDVYCKQLLLLRAVVKQPCQFGKNNAETELRLLLYASQTKLRHLKCVRYIYVNLFDFMNHRMMKDSLDYRYK